MTGNYFYGNTRKNAQLFKTNLEQKHVCILLENSNDYLYLNDK